MTGLLKAAQRIVEVTNVKFAGNQVAAVFVLLTLLMPIAAPIPVWAYDLNIEPAPVNNGLRLAPSGPSIAATLFGAGDNFFSGAAAFLSRSSKEETIGSTDAVAARVKQIETSIDEIEQLTIGQTIQLSAIPLDESGNAVNGIVPEWATKNDAVLKIVDGQAIAMAVGETVLTVKAGDILRNLSIKVAANEETEKGKLPESTALANNSALKALRPQPALLLEDSEQGIRESAYTPENNVGTPPNKSEMDSPNSAVVGRIKHRAGVANYSFGVPFASLPGRGIDASIGMIYNSRVWNKTGVNPSASYQFNVDKNWLAPGFTVGYGKLTSHFSSRSILLTNNQTKTYNEVIPEGYTDSDGTRHQFECKARSTIPGTQAHMYDNTFCSEYGSTDGTFVKVTYHGNRPQSAYLVDDMSAYASTFFTLTYTDGTKVTYSAPGAQFAANDFARDHYPLQIQDRNGNQIDIAYMVGKDTIDYIRDTLGRYIRFYYDSTVETKLVAVTVPGFNGGAERQTVRFYYDENVPLNYQGKFSGTATAPATIRTLRYVYFPASGSGYRYDYHANLGMITKITKLMGMTVSGNSLTSTGSVTSSDAATAAATTDYLYPNDGSQTPLTDVPKYTQRTDDWQGRTTATAPITYYDAPEPATGADRVSEVTVPDTDFDVDYKTVQHNTTDWTNGLAKETTVTRVYTSTHQASLMAKTVYTWEQGIADTSGRRIPVLTRVDVTNDAGQTKANTFTYDGYNNQTVAREHDFAAAGILGTELRRTETTYETGAGWINNRMFRLPKEVKIIVNSTAVSKVVYEYDYSPNGMAATPGVIQHNDDYNPNSGTHQCNPHYECDPGDYPPNCPLEYEECPNHDPGTDFRGNITKVTSFSNATLTTDQDATVNTIKYDITGNVVEASMSCCNVKTLEYSAVNHYAYATKETKGSAPQLVNEATYDFNTGLVLNTKDENNQQTVSTYDAATLRQTRVDYSNGAWTTVDEYNDTVFPYHVKSTSSLDATRSISSWSYINGAGQGFRTRSQTANGYISSDVEFDNMGRAIKSFNPYTVVNLGDTRPSSGIPFTHTTKIDALGRTLETKLPDNTIVSAEYTGLVATMTDQAGKKRRQTADALGRIKRVDEPNADGLLEVGGVPVQPTDYEYDGNNNLTKVTQTGHGVTQERLFKYDALSRLTHERQVEATATLNDIGVKQTSGGLWTGFYKYTTDGLLDYGVDARGVKTDFTYDGLNRVTQVEYTGDPAYTTPTVEYTYSETESGFFNNGRLTKVRTLPVSTAGQTTPETVQNYDYDQVGQVKKHIQTIGNQTYQLEYGYNLAGQLTSEKYPSGKIVSMTVDNYGVTQTIADAQRTYFNGVTFDNRGVLSQINFGNGTSETFSLNDRFQMESQSLKKGTEVLQKYDYKYGKINSTDGAVDTTKNNGQLARIESFIGGNKQSQQRFEYDSIGRLSQSSEYRGDNSSLTYKQKFDFDRFGNLYRKVSSNLTTDQQNPLLYTPIEDSDINKATNRFTSNTTYDDAGQVITDNKFRQMGFSYDANGRNVKVTKSGSPDAWTVYDALGNRVATKINDVWQYMVYDAFGQLVAEYGLSSSGTGGVKYIQQDWQGSVRAVTNNNGFVVSRTDHQAFGDEVSSGVGLRTPGQGYSGSASTRQGYGLTENDAGSGQQHTWFRKLETQAGRWSSPDPYKGSMSLGNPQSFNRYAYVGNEPTNFVDPSGLMMSICHAQEGGGFFCSGGWSSGGGSYNYNPNALGRGYYGADAGYGTITVTNTFIWDPESPERRIHSYTRVYTFGFSPFGGYSGGRSRVPEFVRQFYETWGQEFNKCAEKIFGKKGARALGRQSLGNAPNIDMSRSSGQLGGLGSVSDSDLERGPRGSVNIARNITAVPTPNGGAVSANEMRIRTYAHELGNLLAGRLAGSMTAARQAYGTPGGLAGSITGQLDPDAGARFEACTMGRFVS